MRRVVVTGLWMVSPLGGDVETSWRNILASKSGAGRITHFDPADYACKIACEVKPADHEYGFDPGKRVDHKVQRQVDPFIIYGLDAAGQALEDAGLTDMDEATRLRAGVSLKPLDNVRAAQKPAMPMRQTGDSVPPATMTSASPSAISRVASPIACAPVEQAVTTAWFGPIRPYLMLT